MTDEERAVARQFAEWLQYTWAGPYPIGEDRCDLDILMGHFETWFDATLRSQ